MLVEMVGRLYNENPESRSFVESYFLVDESEVSEISDPGYSSDTEETDVSKPKSSQDGAEQAAEAPLESPASSTPTADFSRKKHRYAQCAICRSRYDVSENNKSACNYHDGKIHHKQLYWGLFCRPGRHIASKANFERHPKGFYWLCCQKSGDQPGCRTGPHVDIRERGSQKPRQLIGCCRLPKVMEI
ncbi:hypothetical protein HDK64DRAFT_283673 [Phyllosticta capitalensis]